jgi:hypothetical protein
MSKITVESNPEVVLRMTPGEARALWLSINPGSVSRELHEVVEAISDQLGDVLANDV